VGSAKRQVSRPTRRDEACVETVIAEFQIADAGDKTRFPTFLEKGYAGFPGGPVVHAVGHPSYNENYGKLVGRISPTGPRKARPDGRNPPSGMHRLNGGLRSRAARSTDPVMQAVKEAGRERCVK
jgi:hypothetical protein